MSIQGGFVWAAQVAGAIIAKNPLAGNSFSAKVERNGASRRFF
jgi:hypothetical protein